MNVSNVFFFLLGACSIAALWAVAYARAVRVHADPQDANEMREAIREWTNALGPRALYDVAEAVAFRSGDILREGCAPEWYSPLVRVYNSLHPLFVVPSPVRVADTIPDAARWPRGDEFDTMRKGPKP